MGNCSNREPLPLTKPYAQHQPFILHPCPKPKRRCTGAFEPQRRLFAQLLALNRASGADPFVRYIREHLSGVQAGKLLSVAMLAMPPRVPNFTCAVEAAMVAVLLWVVRETGGETGENQEQLASLSFSAVVVMVRLVSISLSDQDKKALGPMVVQFIRQAGGTPSSIDFSSVCLSNLCKQFKVPSTTVEHFAKLGVITVLQLLGAYRLWTVPEFYSVAKFNCGHLLDFLFQLDFCFQVELALCT